VSKASRGARRRERRPRNGGNNESTPAVAVPPPDASKPWVGLGVVAIVAAFLCPVVFTGPSRMDDPATILLNPHFDPPTFTAGKVLWYWSNSDGLGLYIPITYTTWGLLARATYVPTPDELGQHVDVRVFHAASLAWHLINVGLVYALLRGLLTRQVAGRDPRWPAAAGALLYGLHPLQVEAVAWLSGMKDLMSASASLGSVLLYLRAVDPAPGTTSGSRRAMYVTGLLLVPIGMLCKPTAMVAPLIAAALDLLIVRRPLRRVALAIAPYLLAALPLAIVARVVQPLAGVPAPPIWQRPIVSGRRLLSTSRS